MWPSAEISPSIWQVLLRSPCAPETKGYVANSAKALAAYADETYRDFAAAPELSLTVGKGLESLAEPCSVDALLNTLEAWLKGEIK